MGMGLEVSKLTKKFVGQTTVDQLSLTMNRPEVYGLIGSSGSGKTTTVRLMLGLIEPTSGQVLWNGRPIRENAKDVGYLPESRRGYSDIKVLDQMILFAMLHGLSRKEARESARQLLSTYGLEHTAKLPLKRVSKVDRQLVEILEAFVHRPDLVFLDEPFTGLDPVGAEKMDHVIRQMREDGCYVILSTHRVDKAEEYCDDIIMLDHGKTILSGNLKQIKRNYGHTNLVVACDVDVTDTAKDFGMELIEKRAQETEYRIDGDDEANALLAHMLSQGFYPTKYEIREPSLSEIFMELTGGETE